MLGQTSKRQTDLRVGHLDELARRVPAHVVVPLAVVEPPEAVALRLLEPGPGGASAARVVVRLRPVDDQEERQVVEEHRPDPVGHRAEPTDLHVVEGFGATKKPRRKLASLKDLKLVFCKANGAKRARHR